ncbi:uncharacterized protein [Mytilus edulis]|uniref:uncharacterized protein n=1 Tax=Mytilus edulis TaxID=6550 RepID=UPI0039F008E2
MTTLTKRVKKKKKSCFSQSSLEALYEYHDALNISSSLNNEQLRSCEKKLIKLDKNELEGFFRLHLPDSRCVFLQFLHLFCKHGQEKKLTFVKVQLNVMLHSLTENDRYNMFDKYLYQRLKTKSNLTEIDLLTDQIDPPHQFLLKLCYWNIFCAKKDSEGCKEFLRKYADVLVSNIEALATNFQWSFFTHEKRHHISCKILLCLLNWNICEAQTQITLQNIEKPAFSSVDLIADTSTNYSFTEFNVRTILYKLLSTLSEDALFNAFNYYLEDMYAMKSEITDDDFCTDKIDPYNEFQLKLCYCEKLCNVSDDEKFMKFFRRNAYFLVSHIEEVVEGNTIKLKLVSCKILLYLVQMTTRNPHILQKTVLQASPSVTLKDYSPNDTIRGLLQTLLSVLSEDGLFTVLNNYLKKLYLIKSKLTEDDFCTGKIEPYYEFLLKLCHCEKLCSKNDDEAYRDILIKNADLFVSQIPELHKGNKTKIKLISCKVLLCLLNWNICKQQTKFSLSEIQISDMQTSVSFISEAGKTNKSVCTMYKVRCVLQNLLSTLTDNDISEVFNDYIEQQYSMKSEITADGLCIGEKGSHHELLLKVCFYEKLCKEIDVQTLRKFFRTNADFIVKGINKSVLRNQKKFKLISCKILLCLLNSNICNISIFEAENTNKSVCTMNKVRCVLKNLLSTLTDNDISEVFNDYIEQQYSMKLEITADGLCIGEKGSHHEFKLKLCFFEKLCKEKDVETLKRFLRNNAKFLAAQIKKVILGNQTKTKWISCKILLCLLNRNICNDKTATSLTVQNAVTQDTPSVPIVAYTSAKHSCIENTKTTYLFIENSITGILQSLLSVLSEEEILKVLIDYFKQLYNMKLDVRDDDFFTGKIEPYQEFLMKLCYSETLCSEKDDEHLKKFLRRNVDYLVPQIKEVVDLNKSKMIKYVSCKIMLCLSKWGICYMNTSDISLKTILSQTLTLKADCQDLINENAPVFLSMVDTVMTKNDIPVLNELCNVLLCIPYNERYFHDVADAVNKLIRCHATQEGMGELVCNWITTLGCRILKHLNDNQKLDNVIKIEIDFQNLNNLMEDLFTDNCHDKIIYWLIRDHFRTSECCYSYYHRNDFVSRLYQLWTDKIKCKLKTIQFSNEIRNKGKEVSINKHEKFIPMKFLRSNNTMSEKNFIAEWEEDLQEDHLNAQKTEAQLKEIKMIDQMANKLKLFQIFVLFMISLTAGTSTGHHKSAKMKKYLTLKYEYDKASLYLLWCSGDIEVHPGPCLKKASLIHHSSIERRWINNISQKLIKLLPSNKQSKYKATKIRRNDRENKEHLKTLLTKCQDENVQVQKLYLSEIRAWESMEYKLLHKLFIYRCENEILISSIQDFFTNGGNTNALIDLNISFISELQTSEIAKTNMDDQNPKDKSQIMVYLTRHIAGISIKCAHGIDPDAKFDGLWDLPLKNWPKNIILFDPNNRGKYNKRKFGKKLISDQELVDLLLTLPQITFPQKYKDVVDAYKVMRKSKNKQHKAELCKIFIKTRSLEKIDFSLKSLWINGIFTDEVHNTIIKWVTTGAVENGDDKKLSSGIIDGEGQIGRPHILINISTKCITLSINPVTESSSHVRYDFPFNDELVLLKTMATVVNQNKIQEPSSDFHKKFTAKKSLKLIPTSDSKQTENQTESIIIPQEAMDMINSYTVIDRSGNVLFENGNTLPSKILTQATALSSMTHLEQSISSKFQFNQSLTQTGQQVSITSPPDPSNCNEDYLRKSAMSVRDVSQNFDMCTTNCHTTNIESLDLISSINSEVVPDSGHQFKALNGNQLQLTGSNYSSDNSSNPDSQSYLPVGSKSKKRKCNEEKNGKIKERKKQLLSPHMKDRTNPLSDQVKQQTETDMKQMAPFEDNSIIVNTNMNLLLNLHGIDLEQFDFHYLSSHFLENEIINDQSNDYNKDPLETTYQESNDNTMTNLEDFLEDMI